MPTPRLAENPDVDRYASQLRCQPFFSPHVFFQSHSLPLPVPSPATAPSCRRHLLPHHCPPDAQPDFGFPGVRGIFWELELQTHYLLLSHLYLLLRLGQGWGGRLCCLVRSCSRPFADWLWIKGRGEVLNAACLLPRVPLPRGVRLLEPALSSHPSFLSPGPKAQYPGAITVLG